MDQPAKPTTRQIVPWLYPAAAVVMVVWVLATGQMPEPTWRFMIAVMGLSAPILGWRLNQMPSLAVPALALASIRLAFGPTTGNVSPGDVQTLWALADAAIGVALVATLGVVLIRRRGKLLRRDLVDGLAVTLGSALLAWILFAGPLVDEHGTGLGTALLVAAYFPSAALLVTFTVDLLCVGLISNRAMQLVVAATVVNLLATLVSLLHHVGTFGDLDFPAGLLMYVVSFALLCASSVHRDCPESMSVGVGPRSAQRDSVARLLMIGLSVVAPIGLIASVRATSDADTIIRTVGTLVLMSLVVIRLSIAMHQSATAQTELIRRLDRDDLTGLPTRSRFVGLVSENLETTWRSEFRPTIIQLNLDRFKNINDILGHYDANEVLVAISDRLSLVANEFGGVAARAGGDDFVLLDASTRSSEDALACVAAIRAALAPAVTVGDSTMFVTASIGVAMAPRNRTVTAEEMMRRTDIATHRAKANGRNSMAIFDDSMQAQLTHRMDVEHALHGAIGRREMRLYHQPIVDIVTGRVSGFEALMRWKRGDEMVSPGEFIPIAEETGIICELGAWALHEALTELRTWIDDGIVEPTTTMSVNVSPRQIADPNFADVVQDVLDNTGVSPHLLWIEMTESMMLEEPELAQSTLRKIRQMGVRLALDDFGTGFSSLSLLQQFPIQRIKIDRAFVSGIAEHSNDRSLVRTIIAMANSMGLDLVAEGVETVYQLQSLRELECNKAQGFLISHPVPAEAMRSTMAALDELTSLSLFAPAGTSGSGHALDAPCTEPDGSPSSLNRSPVGISMSRPLGQPIF